MKLSAYRDYWNGNCRICIGADLMLVKLFEKLCLYIYFCGITNVRIENRYAKVLLVLNAFPSNCIKIEPDYSIDEAMIPYKGKN